MTDPLEQNLREALSDRAAQLDAGAADRVRALDYRPRQRRFGKLPAFGALGTAGIAGAVVAAVTLSAGTATAFAGWTSTPTAPAPAQVAQAVQDCGQGLGSPVLTEDRGPYTAAIYSQSNTTAVCVTGDNVSMSDSYTFSKAITEPAGEAQLEVVGTRDSAGNEMTYADGRVGTGVTAVTIDLSDGSSVQATVSNGWYMAWWPGAVTATNAQVSGAAGTTTEAFPTSPTLPTCTAGAKCSSSFATVGAGGGSASGSTSISGSGVVTSSGTATSTSGTVAPSQTSTSAQ